MRSGPVIGVDVGTSSAKAVVFAPGSGVLGSGSAEHPTRVPRPGWAEQDPAAWWTSVMAAVRAAVASAGVAGRDVTAIAVSGQGAALVALDGAGVPVFPALIHLDQRAAVPSVAWRSDAAHGAWNVAAKLGWLRAEAPAASEAAAVFTSASGYLLRRLTGEAWQSHSDAGIADLYDVAARGWSARGLAAAGVDQDRLPQLASSTSVVGSLRPGPAADLGLSTSCLVVAGGEDTSSAALAAGVTGPADGFLSLGSAAVLGVAVPAGGDGPVPVLRFPHVLDGLDLLSGSNATAGAALRWLAGLLGRPVDELLALAAAEPAGADGVDFLPYLAGELHPVADPAARGVFAGLSLAAGPGTLARAVVEGTASAIAHNLAAARSAGATPDALVAVGGPARSALWCQAIADATGLPVTVASGDGAAGAAVGDAMLAAGEDSGEARVLAIEHLRTGRRHEPDPSEHDRAGQRLERLQRLYAATRG
ncbi:xylulokinase [Jiangella alkaliphila]|uniref:Xylulokinase n=1 Tax=Jiangella alkaliphila TaxID=419479 RepID=A0A1H2L336_9ACTN|nr:FGGY family carbohydrate kinase [Jiangella alkaliphila]SDU75477.1 xylulokinase [Jiangella alkaliphila]